MKRLIWRILPIILALAACSNPMETNATNGASGAAQQPSAAEADRSGSGNVSQPLASVQAGNGAAGSGPEAPARGGEAAAPASAARPSGDSCNAGKYRYLVGQHRSNIPPEPAGETWRVTCTSCPMTMDYSERRLNILYDERSGIVQEVRCG